MTLRSSISAAVVASVVCVGSVHAQSATGPGTVGRANLDIIEAVRVSTGPSVDGLLNEPAWRSAAVVDRFVQQEPDLGAPVSERTEVRILYDAERLYLGVRAFDSQPDAVLATEMRRDADRILKEDNFQVIFDTFLDSRSGYMFVTNPLGAKLEQQIFEEGEGGRRNFGGTSNINRNWDGVWDVAARRTPEGWAAEIAIPFVTLRFPDTESQTWGINFMRNIARKNEQAYWSPIARGYTLTRVSRAGTLNGLRSIDRGLDLRIKPFLVGGGVSRLENGVTDASVRPDMGIDIKYGITAGLNLDLTINTDFAQAEVDNEQVNLTRFPLFFPEKREFFLENAGQFDVGTTGASTRLADLFFSRRIGISPDGEPIPILAGARLTGRIGDNNIAVMDVQTDAASGQPGTNFLVARYSRNILTRSKIGGIIVNKQATGDGDYNRTIAADMQIALNPSLTVNGFLARTMSPGVSHGQMGGHIRANLLNQHWNIYAEYTDLGNNFEPEVGFVPRIGIRTSKVHFEYDPRPGRLGIRVLEPMVNFTYTTDQTGRLLSRRTHYMVGTQLDNGAYINIWYNDHYERLDQPFAVHEDIVIAPGGYRFGDWHFSFRSNPARRIYGSITYAPQGFFDGTRTDSRVSLGLRVNSRLSAEAKYARNDVQLADGDFIADVGSLRIDFALSPTMTLRTLTQYNSLTEQWSTSARFHYLYRPGSDFYIVYDEVRRDLAGFSPYRERRLILKLTYLVSR